MIFFSNNLLDLIIYPHSYILPAIFFFTSIPLWAWRYFSFIFLKTIVTILKLLKSIYIMMFLRPRKNYFYFLAACYMRIHTIIKQEHKKKYISIYINNVTLRIWLPIQQQLFFQCHNSRCWDGSKNVSSYELFCEGREYILVMLVPWLIFYWPISTF